MSSGGYIYIKIDEKWVLEHRHVMAETLGRPLERHERVVHKDDDNTNNDPANLELWRLRKRDPLGVRAADYHCAGCRCFDAPKVRYNP